MGAAQSIPVIGEIVTVAESGGKTIAAGACKVFGADDAAQELIDGAGKSWENYAEVNLIVSNVRVVAAKIDGDDKEADRLLGKQGDAWTEVAENTPVVGHAVGVYHYIDGDTDAGDRCMIGASRTTAVMVATVATGGLGAGALAVGSAAAGAGLAYDGIATGINSAVKDDFAPTGTIAAVKHAVETGNASDIFDVAAAPVGDFTAGALHGYVKGKAAGGAIPETVTPAVELARERIGSTAAVLEHYEAFGERPGTCPQVPHADIVGNPNTVGLIQEFASPGEAMSNLEPGASYDFVRLEDGKVRYIKHSDAVMAAKELEAGKLRIGHTSLVAPEAEVVAAGEIHVDSAGVINNINCQSGHFRIPLEVMTRQIGRQFPVSVLTLNSPLFTRLLGNAIASSPVFKAVVKAVYVYSPTVLAILTEDDSEQAKSSNTPLAKSTHVLAVKEQSDIKVISFFCGENARAAYDASPVDLPRFLWSRTTGELVASEDEQGCVDVCKASALSVNSVLPKGGWKEVCRDVETWWDEALGKYELRCTHAAANGVDFTDETLFEKEDVVEVRDGALVNCGRA